MTEEYNFDYHTPIYNSQIDDWGFLPGTRVWMGDYGNTKVEDLQIGDIVLGIAFRLEPTWLPIQPESQDPRVNLVHIWQPVLCERRITNIRKVLARPWELTFGDRDKQLEVRRLVAGASTRLVRFPLRHDVNDAPKMYELHTAIPNVRMEADVRPQMIENPDGTVSRHPLGGTTRGDQITIIPYEHIAALDTITLQANEPRNYKRYLFTQVRNAEPLAEPRELYQIEVTPDTREDLGVKPGQFRANVIVQTPFPPTVKKVKVARDDTSLASEHVRQAFGDWVSRHQPPDVAKQSGPIVEDERRMQGMFYKTQNDPLFRGFLNGGILVDLGSNI